MNSTPNPPTGDFRNRNLSVNPLTEAEVAKAAYWPAYTAAVRRAPSNRNGQGIAAGDAEKAALAGYEAVVAAVEPLIRERLALEIEAELANEPFPKPIGGGWSLAKASAARIVRGAAS